MRTFNRTASLVLGLVLIAGGLLVIMESLVAAFHRGPWLVPLWRWYEALTSAHFADRPTVLMAFAVGLVGLALLLAEIRPWPPYRLPARPAGTDATTEWWVLRRPANRLLTDTVAHLSGVRTARVRLHGRDRWTVDVRVEAREESRARIEEAVNAALARLAAPASAEIRLRLRTPRKVT
jgi:uncharacterized protein DUF6286